MKQASAKLQKLQAELDAQKVKHEAVVKKLEAVVADQASQLVRGVTRWMNDLRGVACVAIGVCWFGLGESEGLRSRHGGVCVEEG